MTISSLDTIIEKTLDYLDVPAVVGHDRGFKHRMANEYRQMGLTVDIYDNLICVYGSKKYETIVSAHFDRHGLISIGYGEYAYAGQYVREIRYGQNDRTSQQLLEKIAGRFVGEHVYGYNPTSLEKIETGIITACAPNIRNNGDAIFHIEGMRNLPVDTPIAYARPARYHRGFLKGQIDNALSLATVYALFKNGYQGTALLTTEEEIGKSWSHMQDFLTQEAIHTDKILVLDTSPYSEHRFVNDGTVVLRTRDKSGMFNLELCEALADYCDANKIPFHFKDQYLLGQGKEIRHLGSTELGRLIMGTAGQWSGASIQVPTLAYHTSYESTTSKAIKNYYHLLSDILVDRKMPLLYA